ncbi:MAG TPA: TIGR03084 family metal-binding protein [Streptosporangiaceae bacterium]|nr:TIGR03084 family metal-binding protein [Streptosporangiaceae bacterium]
MAATDAVLPDLAAEGDELDQLVASIEPDRWRTETPSPGWTIAHQIGHLAASDRFTALAVTDPEAFAVRLSGLSGDLSEINDAVAADAAVLAPEDLLIEWRAARAEALAALSSVPVVERVQWIVTPMSPASLASTRLMELVGHGQDIRDALDVTWVPTDRILHVARIGARTRNFAYRIRGIAPPPQDFRIELVAPSGELWTFGPPEAPQRVSGSAADFCLLVTRRRHRADLDLRALGDDAEQWLDFAQAYAGPPSAGRAAGQFRAAGR